MHPKHTSLRVMTPQLHDGSNGQRNGSSRRTNGTNGHPNFRNGNETSPTSSSSPSQAAAFELNPKDHDIKVVIRNGRIVAGEETLPFKRNRFGMLNVDN